MCLQREPQSSGNAKVMSSGQGVGHLQNLHAGLLYQTAQTRMSLCRSRSYVLMQLITRMQELQIKEEM